MLHVTYEIARAHIRDLQAEARRAHSRTTARHAQAQARRTPRLRLHPTR